MSVELVWNRPELDRLLHARTGEVGMHLMKRADAIMIAAKAQVGVRTGLLQASINVNYERTAVGPKVLIGSPLSYALLHHEGSRPHIIVSSPGKLLSFSSRGQRVVTHRVAHPGTRPNRYLTDHLKLAIT